MLHFTIFLRDYFALIFNFFLNVNIFSNHFQRCYKTEFWKYAAALVVLHFSMDQFPQFAAYVQIKLSQDCHRMGIVSENSGLQNVEILVYKLVIHSLPANIFT